MRNNSLAVCWRAIVATTATTSSNSTSGTPRRSERSALELAPEKITVNGISPGPFATEMNKPLIENAALSADFLAKIPLGTWGRPEDIGKLAVYLCSDAAAFVTGTDFLIDGGWTAQ